MPLAGKATIGAQHDPHLRPAPPDVGHEARHLVLRPGRGVDVRAPQFCRQEMPAAEDIERQVAVTVVVAVEEPALLVAVQRIVGGVEVENDLLGRLAIRVQEDIKVTAASSRQGYARPATGIWRGEFTPPWEWRQQDRRR